MSWNRSAHRRDGCEFLVDLGFLRRTPHESTELGGELGFDGGAAVGLDLWGAGRLIERRLEPFHACVVGGCRNAGTGDANDIGFDDDVVGPADEKKVFDIVTTEKEKLPLPVEIVYVDDAEPRLAAAATAVAAGHHQSGACQLAEDYTEEHEQDQNDRERNRELDCP